MTGDQADIFGRLRAALPLGWFPVPAPILDGVLWGAAFALAQVYSLIQYLKLQTRIATSTDGNLDMIAADFLGNFLRNLNESDTSYRLRILTAIFRERATRPALSAILTALTGNVPVIVEPWRPSDTGGYGVACGYGAGGAYGSTLCPYTAFVTVYRRASIGVPNVPGYGASQGGYGVACSYISGNELISITDQNIYTAIESVRPIGTQVWVQLKDAA